MLPLRSVTVRRQAAAAAEGLPELARRMVAELLEQLWLLDERIDGYDRELGAQARLCEPAQRLMKIRGIGATTALAIVATVGNAREFRNGRQFAAWLGLVPGQYSTGGKARLGRHLKIADARGKRLGRSFRVKLWPTLVVLADGREVARLVRPAAVGDIEQALGKASADTSRC